METIEFGNAALTRWRSTIAMALSSHTRPLSHRQRSHANRSRFSTGESDESGSHELPCISLLGTNACTGAASVRGVTAQASRGFGSQRRISRRMYFAVEDGRRLFERLTAPSGGTETDYEFESAPLLRVLPSRPGGASGHPRHRGRGPLDSPADQPQRARLLISRRRGGEGRRHLLRRSLRRRWRG